ncbi:MAG: ADP-ribosylglycohydrolase family protein [Anaerolineae bacterium]|nr:ADP-ribosylglycohydrolase family protein [Anaerolineae bacterium]
MEAALAELPPPTSFPYVEPSDLEGIRAVRPVAIHEWPVDADTERLYDRIYGAWLARCAGCTLGKPVEGWHREKIARYLKMLDDAPLTDYFRALDNPPKEFRFHRASGECLRGRIRAMARDDDIDYTILGLHLLESKGRDFRTEDVADAWLTLLPYQMVYTAERAAYRSLVEGRVAPETATYRNPCREWIGAQIRADAWGYANPGNPERAAEYAWRDARLSHVKNGIYGEMWVAAMLAAALAGDKLAIGNKGAARERIENVIGAGLGEIPAQSRLAEAIRETLTVAREEASWEDAWDRLMAKYSHYHWIHTINNAICVALGLLYGQGDLGQTICVAVACGFDTDCNGATAGSVLGAMLGAKALPEKWVSPLNDLAHSGVFGFDNSIISDLARRTTSIALAA